MSECRICRVEIDSANMSFGTDEVCAGCDNYTNGKQAGLTDGEVVVPKALLKWVENVREYFKSTGEGHDDYACERQKLQKLNKIWPETKKVTS